MARMTSHGQPVEALAHAGETVLRTESVKSVDRRTETNCGSKTLNQRQQHIGAAAGEDSGHGETSLDQHLLETEVETAEAWATYLAECFDSYKLIQHAGAYSFAGDCSGADAPWQVIRQLQKALEKRASRGSGHMLSLRRIRPMPEIPHAFFSLSTQLLPSFSMT